MQRSAEGAEASPTCIRCQNGLFGQNRGAFGGITKAQRPVGPGDLIGARIGARVAARFTEGAPS